MSAHMTIHIPVRMSAHLWYYANVNTQSATYFDTHICIRVYMHVCTQEAAADKSDWKLGVPPWLKERWQASCHAIRMPICTPVCICMKVSVG